MDIGTLGTVVSIVAICYVVGLGCKSSSRIQDNLLNAVAVGMANGLAATGVNQLYKQQCKE